MEIFKNFYLKYYQKVFVTCLLILKNTALAEDATQEAFIKAYLNIHTLKDPEKFGAWVAAIATKHSINVYNRNKRILCIEEQKLSEQYLEMNNERLYENEPCSEYLVKERTEEILEVIYSLNPLLKQMIILKYYWMLTDPEIAEMLKMPIGTVKSSLFRARKILAKKMKVKYQEEKLIKGEVN